MSVCVCVCVFASVCRSVHVQRCVCLFPGGGLLVELVQCCRELARGSRRKTIHRGAPLNRYLQIIHTSQQLEINTIFRAIQLPVSRNFLCGSAYYSRPKLWPLDTSKRCAFFHKKQKPPKQTKSVPRSNQVFSKLSSPIVMGKHSFQRY